MRSPREREYTWKEKAKAQPARGDWKTSEGEEQGTLLRRKIKREVTPTGGHQQRGASEASGEQNAPQGD